MPPHPVFRVTELMDMAIRIEEHGQAFYEACLATTDNAPMKEVFHYLLEQEKEHARVFSRMKENLDPEQPLPESYPGELRHYLDAFVKGEIFDDPKAAQKLVETLEDEKDAVEVALELEKQSILFYSGIKSMIRDAEAAQVDRIIAEEHDHIRRLQSFRSTMREQEP